MKIFGITGWSGSGKTTLVRRLIPQLVGQGLGVGTIKHSHHDVRVGDDATQAQLAAGALECLVAGPDRFALMHDHQGRAEPDLAELTTHFAGLDLVLVEGFKFSPHPKLEVWSADTGQPVLALTDPTIVAVAAETELALSGRPVLSRDDVDAICNWITDFCKLSECRDC